MDTKPIGTFIRMLQSTENIGAIAERKNVDAHSFKRKSEGTCADGLPVLHVATMESGPIDLVGEVSHYPSGERPAMMFLRWLAPTEMKGVPMKLSETMNELLVSMRDKHARAETTEAVAMANAIGGLTSKEIIQRKASLPYEFERQGVRQFTAAAKLGLIDHVGDGFWMLTAKGLEVSKDLKSVGMSLHMARWHRRMSKGNR